MGWLTVPWLLVLVLLLAYALHGALLVLIHRFGHRPPLALAPLAGDLPHVAVQLPVFNEANVVERALLAAAALDWPRDRLTVQLLDDSTDATTAIAARCIANLRAQGLDVQHLRRSHRQGFKAGALQHGLQATDAGFVAVFDADFVPPPAFLRDALPHFADPTVACVQGRWTHLDRDRNPLTRAQALAIDAHFAVDQEARAAAGWFGQFNGTAGVWRRTAILAAGGWSGDTLCEDLDLSIRAQLAGWKIVFDRDLVCPGELPDDLAAFMAQQRRWATGTIQVARKVLPAVFRSRARLGKKLAAALHLTHYAVHPLIVASAVLAVPCVLLPGATDGPMWPLVLPFGLACLGPALSYLYAQRELRQPVGKAARDLLPLTLLGTGVALSNSGAVLRALRSQPGAFERTPKRGAAGLLRYAAADDGIRTGEWALAAWCGLAAAGVAATGVWAAAPVLVLYACGFAAVARGTWLERT